MWFNKTARIEKNVQPQQALEFRGGRGLRLNAIVSPSSHCPSPQPLCSALGGPSGHICCAIVARRHAADTTPCCARAQQLPRLRRQCALLPLRLRLRQSPTRAGGLHCRPTAASTPACPSASCRLRRARSSTYGAGTGGRVDVGDAVPRRRRCHTGGGTHAAWCTALTNTRSPFAAQTCARDDSMGEAQDG